MHCTKIIKYAVRQAVRGRSKTVAKMRFCFFAMFFLPLTVFFHSSAVSQAILWSYVGGERELSFVGGRYDGLGSNFSPLNWPGQRSKCATCSLGPYSDRNRHFIFVCLFFFLANSHS